jgi:chromosome segregation ATPase
MFSNDNYLEHLASLEARIQTLLVQSNRDLSPLVAALERLDRAAHQLLSKIRAAPVEGSDLKPQNSDLKPQNSDLKPQNSDLKPQNSDLLRDIRRARIENSRILDQLEARDQNRRQKRNQNQEQESKAMTTERWTDETLDRLAALTESNAGQIQGLRDSIAELRESSREQREDIAATQVTVKALLQLAAQDRQKWELSQARHEETDQRFQILLAEIRHLAGRVDGIEPTA